MAINIEEKSRELKELVSCYETTAFLGRITELFNFIRIGQPIPTLKGLSSPQRQLYYLAALNVTSIKPDTELLYQFSEEQFEEFKALLIDIEQGYAELFYPTTQEEIDEEWIERRKTAMPTFLSYFNQGNLNYEEQVIERVIDYFTPFNSAIEQHFGLSVNEFVEIYNFIREFSNEYLDEQINPKKDDKPWEQFAQEMIDRRLLPHEWEEHLPDHYRNFFEFMSDPGLITRFSKEKVIEKFGEQKANNFLTTLSCKRGETAFLYYTERNILHSRPLFDIGGGNFQAIEMTQIIYAVFNCLSEYCNSQPAIREEFFKIRGIKLEEKCESIFKSFFKDQCFVHKGYYTNEKHEQDLLVIANGMALIIEAKASKRDEPRRDPDKAYPLIVSNFEETIQKGYDQAYRVKKKFIYKEPLEIFADQALKKKIIEIRTKNYHSAYSIVVTLERFGQIQTDLSLLLEIENDSYPWSVCVDDLEVFLLQLKKQKGKGSDLAKFLYLRERIHSKIITADELDVCGLFLKGKMEGLVKLDGYHKISPLNSNIFDQTYQTSQLGLKNEKNVEKKSSGKFIPFGGF